MSRAEAAGHYLQLRVTTGKDSFERVYVPLVSPDETVEAATERWLDEQVTHRRRNVAKARRQLEATIEHARIARPSSWNEANQRGIWAPKTGKKKRR